ncbi:MAG: General secretion pathway protein E, partial [Gammaproteobacteria bacterium]|nr:General secretion pathway protein E [Gammaproteobacteria bacterium]
VIAQRLIRRLCPICREPIEFGDLERNLLGLKVTDRRQVIYKPKGCPACENQGYKGRVALMEVLRLDPDLDELVARRGSPRELLRMALSKGFRPLADAGAARVLDGTTSLDEVSRVVDLTSRLKQN